MSPAYVCLEGNGIFPLWSVPLVLTVIFWVGFFASYLVHRKHILRVEKERDFARADRDNELLAAFMGVYRNIIEKKP